MSSTLKENLILDLVPEGRPVALKIDIEGHECKVWFTRNYPRSMNLIQRVVEKTFMSIKLPKYTLS